MQLFSPGGLIDVGGEVVGETSTMGISAMYRAVSLIAGSLGMLPFESFRSNGDGRPERVGSVFDDPDGPDGQTPYEWKETAIANLVLQGEAIALKVRNVAGTIVRLPLIHPGFVQVSLPNVGDYQAGNLPVGGLWFDISLPNGTRARFDGYDVFYIPGLSLDGKRGCSLLTYARASLSTTIASNKAAGKMFANGAMISGMATPDDDEDILDDVPKIRRDLDRAVLGTDNAGKIAVIARRLKFTPWTMTAADAQFLQSRQFQIEEVSRWTGVPPHLLMQTEKQTSWGTGVDEQNRALGRTVLATWGTRVEQRASRVLASPRYCRFDFAGLERPSPDREIALDLDQVKAGVMTIDEYREKRGWKPLPKQEAQPALPPGQGDPNADAA